MRRPWIQNSPASLFSFLNLVTSLSSESMYRIPVYQFMTDCLVSNIPLLLHAIPKAKDIQKLLRIS